MANDGFDDDGPRVYPDVPVTNAIVRTTAEAQQLAKLLAGEEVFNRCRYHCVTCGWDKTLEFEDGEIAALGGDVRSYGGPCGKCGSMTLTPHSGLMGDVPPTILGVARAQRLDEYRDQADILVDRVKDEIASVMGGSMFDKGGAGGDEAEVSLPDASDVDTDGMEPRR